MINTYYTEQYNEDTRLQRTLKGQLEYHRTKNLATAALGPGPHTIADIGGGTGIHARWMTQAGHTVHLCDIIPEHVQTARQHGIDAVTATATDLPWEDNSHTAALIAGPLYHLKEEEDRHQALTEAVRICKPGSPVMAIAISRHAPLMGRATAGMTRGHQHEVDAIVRTGRCDTAQGWPGLAYYHRAGSLVLEMGRAGLLDVDIVGLNGPAAWLAVAADRHFPRTDGTIPGIDMLEDAIASAEAADSLPGGYLYSSLFFAVGRTPLSQTAADA
jgi:ubiquinone/menaquinone biosynthesis C-methylase UbiE